MQQFYAHSTDNLDKSDWQSLEEHLAGVASLAAEFASVFGAGEWGRNAGLLHDAGKATSQFVKRLEGSPKRVNHSTYGARQAQQSMGKLGLLLSYVIAGHHGGLPDGGAQETQLHFRLKNDKIPADVTLLSMCKNTPEVQLPFKIARDSAGFSLAFFTRMIFSCLTDADFLDTEAFCSPEKSKERLTPSTERTLTQLKNRLDHHLQGLQIQAKATTVNSIRQNILAQCRSAATLPAGFFSLTVPTGGGKTLSSLSFALDHAVAHGLNRIIYAIPFTSIIEQNAEVFQSILGKENVIEHHCNYKEKDKREDHAYDRKRGLASENWDAPVVVTTNVQFFESLFANKSSRCRKLHNIAHSVIILDEAQAIPADYLEPCLAALRELVEHYHCTVVLCTATQPALDDKSSLRMALPNIQEIIHKPHLLYQQLKRTDVSFIGTLTDECLAQRLNSEKQVLCIVSTKPQARAVFKQLSEQDGVFHLSTNMYPNHRRDVLSTVRKRLKAGKMCRVVSTSLVEAGVDLDFPVVYRAMAGLDSIAQAAGRCNREGLLKQLGKVIVFETEKQPSVPWMKRCITRASETLRALPNADPIGLNAMRRYFELLYDIQELDKKEIMTKLNRPLQSELILPFKEIAEQFKFIEDDNTGVIIETEQEAQKLVQQLRYSEHPRSVLRKLQQYTVSVRSLDFHELLKTGALELIDDQFPLLSNPSAYDERVGLCVDIGDVWNPNDLID
ncbi:CRISPR-associated helicase, Cas3 family [Desulfuromusa kysingii]|uniref:CRISPR-associated helicase, Cas3 family n=1 Tax=Desulfuromusa kysingii TaxID=37625 RepID=A0A1H4CLS0_9BACT|nr:CRISPR-associated helicase/endonuclease Cas3 [Desulfuromusa kysingii]SEA61269.1 CRISPR-associated helicase, Cas3 family [Desulfuromusa kysingii]